MSVYARAEVCFAEIIRSFFSVTETVRHTCVHAWDWLSKAFLLVLHLDFLIFSFTTDVYSLASG